MSMPILLFAAGFGTRMGDLTKDRPKPLVRVAGKALIDHALDCTNIPEISNRVVNIHYHGQMIRQHLQSKDVKFSDESVALLETGGGLSHARSLLEQSPVVTMNTDAVWQGPNPLTCLFDEWHNDMDALLLIVPKDQVSGHKGTGDFLADADGRLTRGSGNVYSGVQIIRTDILDEINQTAFSMNVVWDKIAARGGLFGTAYPGQWCDVGQPSSIPIAEAMLDV